MAYAQIAGIIPQYEDQSTWWLKFYQPSTTTPISMSIDSVGGTLLAKAEIDTNGFPTTDGTTLFIPFINQGYDAYLFPTSAEADANDTINAFRVADDVNPFGSDFEQEVTYYNGEGAWVGLTGTLLNVPAVPKGLILVIDGDTQELTADYTYNSATGNIVLTVALTGNEQVFVIYGAIVSVTAAKPTGVQSFANVHLYVVDLNNEVGDKVFTYYYNTDVLCEWVTVPASTGAGDMSDGTLDLTGTSLQGQLVINETMTPLHFGAFGNGITDDTVAVQNCFNVSPYTLINKNYSISSVTAPNYITCAGIGVLTSNTGGDLRVLTITAESVGDVSVDGNGNDVNCIYFPPGLGYSQRYNTLNYKNVEVNVASGNTNTGVTMFGDQVTGGAVVGSNMTNVGHVNGSFPQAFATGEGIYNIESHYIKDGYSGFVPTGGKVNLGNSKCINMQDNGCYLLGGEISIGYHYYDGTEECCQINNVDSCDIGTIVAVGRCLGAFNLQNTIGQVTIGRVIGKAKEGVAGADIADNVPTSICYTRSGSVFNGEIFVGSVEGLFMLGFALSVGTIEEFHIQNVDVTLCYKPSGAPLNPWDANPVANTTFWNFSGVKKMVRRNNRITIKNFEATAFPSGEFSAVGRSPDFDLPSEISDEVWELVEVDGSVASDVTQFRGGKPNTNLRYDNVHWQNSGGNMYMRNRIISGSTNNVNSVPLDGTWQAGTILADRTGTNVQFVCTVTGTPGTWVTK